MNHILRLLFIGFFSTLVFIAGCSGNSNSGVNKDPIQDLDGDGIADIVDPDIDGDGIPNGQDPDDDNDGIEDTVDPTPPAKPSNQTFRNQKETHWQRHGRTRSSARFWKADLGCGLNSASMGSLHKCDFIVRLART